MPYEPTSQDYDEYISHLFAPEDEALVATREAMRRSGLPQINVSTSQGQLLHLLVLMSGTKRILELGTLGGYSAIWLARALPEDGTLISLEIDPHHAQVSRDNLKLAGLSEKVEVRVGPAAQSIEAMQAASEAPFDMVFIDADKEGYPQYLELTLPLLREGGLLLADNALSPQTVAPGTDDGITRYNHRVALHPDLISIIVPSFRARGVGGVLVSLKRNVES